MSLTFKLHKTEGFARRAEIHLNHGVVQTPVFMPGRHLRYRQSNEPA